MSTSTSSSRIPSIRRLKAEGGSGIVCSSYAEAHIVNFSYTIDTARSDEGSIRNAIQELESRSLNWLADKLLPCDGERRLSDALDSSRDGAVRSKGATPGTGMDPSEMVVGVRHLRPDVSRELGIVGLKSWPDDISSSLSNCFPTYNKNDTCTVVFGTVSAFLNPLYSADVVSDTQIGEVERNIRYQMMTLMMSGTLENELGALKHARYLSPIVVMSDKEISMNSASQPYLQHGIDSGMTVTQSILIIAACFAVIGATGLILTSKILFRQEEEYYYSVKQNQTVDDEDDSMIPQASGRYEHRQRDEALLSSDTHQFVESGCTTKSLAVEDGKLNQCVDGHYAEQPQQVTKRGNNTRASRGNDWGTDANMSATMRRMIVKKKKPIVRARGGVATNLGAVLEEDDEEPPTPKVLSD